jgi:hypothetical protein
MRSVVNMVQLRATDKHRPTASGDKKTSQRRIHFLFVSFAIFVVKSTA